MRSRDDRARGAIEGGLRGVFVLATAALLWLSTRPAVAPAGELSTVRGLSRALPRWTVGTLGRVHLSVDSLPSDDVRDWLRALRASGTAVSWAPTGVEPVAVTASPLHDPQGGFRIAVAAKKAALVTVSDEAGVLDTLRAGGSGAELQTPALSGSVRARAKGMVAVTHPAARPSLRRVLVLGRAGWEGKFVAAALEERGWLVDVRLRVAPQAVVGAVAEPAIDTSRYSAVIVLDSSAAAELPAVIRYVRTGGGAILGGEVTGLPALSALIPGSAGARVRGAVRSFTASAPRRALAVRPLLGLGASAVLLERRDSLVAVAAWRSGRGRMAYVGYDETWRWRMQGGDDAVRAHRLWWTRLTGAVAYAPADEVTPGDAPYAAWVSAMGPATSGPLPESTAPPRDWRWLLFSLATVSLLSEVFSRRMRGAR